MEQKILVGKHRTASGKAGAAQCRKEGRIPAVMYDRHGKSMPVDVDSREFMKMFKTVTESTIVTMKLDKGEEYKVFIKDFQHDMVRDTIKHIDFYEVEAGQELRTKVGIKLEGSPEGIRQGGVLESGIADIEVECLPQDLPPRIVVDVTNLGLNETIHVRDLKLSDKIKILTDEDQLVATLKHVAAEIEQTTEDEEAAEGETPSAEEAKSENVEE